MNICIPFERGAHRRALPLFLEIEAKKRGWTVNAIDGPHRHQEEIGEAVKNCDVLVTTSPWWDYINMWVHAAKHYGKPWIYHPEGWDNCHPVIVPGEEAHAKNLGWPYKPDAICAHGTAMGRVLIERQDIDPNTIVYTGSPRFDIYGEYYDEIVKPIGLPFDPDGWEHIILVCTATLWNHDEIISKLTPLHGTKVVVRQHFTDPVDLYKHHDCTVVLPESIDVNSPERDHNYNPDITDLIAYARQLYHADVVVNVAGTSSLEAMMLEVPVININELPKDAPPKEHAKIFGHYGPGAHYADVRAGESSLVGSVDDLPDMVEHAFDNDPNYKHTEAVLNDILSIHMNNHRPSCTAMSSIMSVIENTGNK
jgi:hypothetical protein